MIRTTRLCLILTAGLVFTTGCEPQYTASEFHNGLAYDHYIAESKTVYAALGDPDAEPTAESLRAMILKNQSFEMDRMPVGYWNYLSMGGKYDKYITKDDVAGWAENGVTMMKGPYWDHDDPRQYAKMMDLLDWCTEYDVRLMVPDGRMGDPGDGTPGRTQESKADVAAHPAFFGYHCCDEPRFDLDKPDDPGTAGYAAWMKQQVPNARPFVSMGGYAPGSELYVGTDTYEEYIARFGEFGDLDYFCFNQYGGMSPGRASWNNYFTNMRLVREASWEYGIPFWTSLCSVSHFGMKRVDYTSQIWQLNTAVASGSTGIVWYYYYMRDPQKDYRDAPIDAFWRRSESWEVMRDVHQGFHRRYGDLFLNMAVVKVSFLPEGYGGGSVFEKDISDVVGNMRAGYDQSHPMMVTEFIDLEGQRHVMVVNLDQTKSVFMGVRYLGDDVEIYSYDWDGNEYRGSSYCAYGVPSPLRRSPGVLDGGYQIGPGESFVQRVDSTRIRESELTLQMRELAGLEPQEPLELELARESVEQARAREKDAMQGLADANRVFGDCEDHMQQTLGLQKNRNRTTIKLERLREQRLTNERTLEELKRESEEAGKVRDLIRRLDRDIAELKHNLEDLDAQEADLEAWAPPTSYEAAYAEMEAALEPLNAATEAVRKAEAKLAELEATYAPDAEVVETDE